jgi:hypothetical protein
MLNHIPTSKYFSKVVKNETDMLLVIHYKPIIWCRWVDHPMKSLATGFNSQYILCALYLFFPQKVGGCENWKRYWLFILPCLSTVWNVSMGGKPMCIWSHLFLEACTQLSSKEKMKKIALISNNLQNIATYDPFVFSIPTSKW